MIKFLIGLLAASTILGCASKSSNMNEKIIYQFNEKAKASDWMIVNDGVMGGVSQSEFALNEENVGLFTGEVSTANYGGFASVRYDAGQISTEGMSKVYLKVKGDGKDYQFRLKHRSRDAESYITSFNTTGDWQEITLNLNEFYPSFRGQKLKSPNFNHEYLEQVCFLIANKKNESFRLEISEIALKK